MALPALMGMAGTAAAASPWVVAPPEYEAQAAADALRPDPHPLQIAVRIPLDARSGADGEWRQTPAGRAWSLELASPGARQLSLRLALERIPPGARLVLAADRGPPRQVDLPAGSREIWTPAVAGDHLLLRLELPAGSLDGGLRVLELHHGYRSLAAEPYRSGSCNLDVACPAASAWSDEARAVARLVVQGIYLCTGTLVNNTARDGAPLLLTAHHCVPDAAAAASVVTYWNYQTSACNGTPDGSLGQTRSGATVLATSAAQDLALLRLDRSPAPEFDPYFAGWDRRALIPEAAVTLHHPSGQEKRLSVAATPMLPTSQFLTETPGDGNFLMVPNWATGTTEPGSSGAGLWNQDHRLVGQFSGGYSSCALASPDWFGRLSAGWQATALGTYLDPLGSGAQVLDGMNADGSPGGYPDPGATPAKSAPAGGALDLALLALLLAGWANKKTGLRRFS